MASWLECPERCCCGCCVCNDELDDDEDGGGIILLSLIFPRVNGGSAPPLVFPAVLCGAEKCGSGANDGRSDRGRLFDDPDDDDAGKCEDFCCCDNWFAEDDFDAEWSNKII